MAHVDALSFINGALIVTLFATFLNPTAFQSIGFNVYQMLHLVLIVVIVEITLFRGE